MKKVIFITSLLVVSNFNFLIAEPYIAARTGLKCAVCHINRSGGGKRTDYGVMYSQSKLSMKNIRPDGEKNGSYFSNRLGENVTIGGNLRIDEVRKFKYTSSNPTTFLDSLGGRDTVMEVGEASRAANITEGNIYIQAELIPHTLSFCSTTVTLTQRVAPSSAPRELFGMYEGLPLNSYVKFGRMLLPYGYRLLDDLAFVRGKVGYTYGRNELAAEIGIEPGPFSWIINATNTEMSTVATVVWRRFRVGASYAFNRENTENNLYGVFGGTNFGQFTLLGEVDIIKKDVREDRAYYSEMDILLTQGLNFKTTYEVFDLDAKNIPIENNGQQRGTIGLEWFITQFLQVGAFYRINEFIPQNVGENQDNMILRTHIFF